MRLARGRRLRWPQRASERGPERLLTAGNPQRFDPATTDWMSLQGIVEEMEVVCRVYEYVCIEDWRNPRVSHAAKRAIGAPLWTAKSQQYLAAEIIRKPLEDYH